MGDEIKNNAMLTLEFQMAIDNLKNWSPLFMERYVLTNQLRKSKYDSAIAAGFTEQQAMEIVTKTPIED